MDEMSEMMKAMLGSMSKEEKLGMMGTMMETFFADMSVEDKQRMMEQMMPKMMEGINMMEMMPRMMMGMMGGGGGDGMMGMMSHMMGRSESREGMPKMMGGCHGEGMGMMPHMMIQMMPNCAKMMLPSIPKEERMDFVSNMVATLMEQGSVGMSEEEKSEFVARILEKVTS